MGKNRKRKDEAVGLPAHMEDEIDAFANSKDKITLNLSDEDLGGVSDEEEAVLDLPDSSSEDDEDSSELEEELDAGENDDGASSSGYDSQDLEMDIRKGGEIGRLAKQAKAVREELKRLKSDSDEDSDEADEQGDDAELMEWGSSEFHSGDKKKSQVDIDMLKDEETEAVRLQQQQLRSLKDSDLGVDLSSDDDEEDASPAGRVVPIGRQGENLAKDLNAVAGDERLAAVLEDAPELMALCRDLKDSLAEVRRKVDPLLTEARDGELCESEGLSYLEVKHHLLLHYCICIMYYLMMKLEGKSVKEHPVILRLVEIRTYLEKLRPVDARLQYQVDKLLRATQMAKASEDQTEQQEDALQFGPRPEALLAGTVEDNGEADGVYRPPKLNPVAMDTKEDEKERKQLMADRKKAARSEMVTEMVQELTGAPEEVHEVAPGWDTGKAIRALRKMEERSKIEEEMFTRVRLTKEERKKLKAHKHRAGMAGGAVLADFGDEVRDTLGATGKMASRSSQTFAVNPIPQKGRHKSGDEDAPSRASLVFRQQKYKETRGTNSRTVRDNEQLRRQGEKADAKAKAKKEAARKLQLRTKPPAAPSTTQGPRKITREIEKNRGLTPHRRKDIKNPRKRQRERYEKAQKKRKGMVQDVRKTENVYGGEQTGIKRGVTKSVRFKG